MKKMYRPNPFQAIQIFTLLFLPFAASSNTYTVTNTLSSGAGSFRQALIDANANPGADVIAFNIGGGGAHTVDANFPGSVLGSDLTIDGTTQPGYSGTPLIEIWKSSLSVLNVQGANVWIKGLAFNNGGNGAPAINASSGWSNLKVEDCRFTQVRGGVYANSGADIQIINCDFDMLGVGTGNSAISLQYVEENLISGGVLAYGNTFSVQEEDSWFFFFELYGMQDLLIGNQDVPGANITIEDDAGFATSHANCVGISDCHGIVFDNLQLVKTGDAGELGLGMDGCTDVTIQNCTFGNLNSACSIVSCQDVQILDNTFANCGKGAEVFLNIVITDLGSNLLPNGLLVSGNQFSDIGRGIGITVGEGLNVGVGSPTTPDANIILTEDDGHDDIETDVIYCGYEVGLGVGNYTIRDLDFTGKGAMSGTGLSFMNGSAIGLVENCRISNFEFGVAVNQADVAVQCNLIYDNATGVVRYGDENGLVENNTFVDNMLAVDNSQFTTTQLNAENNYWGGGAPALNGPNGYTGDVDAHPYLNTPPGCAPTLPNSDITISGTLIWEHDDATGVGNATVALTGDQSGSVVTLADGIYSFTVTSGSNFTVTPTKNINKLNGITVADATAIQKHVAGVIPITDPYKLVGADVNKSNSVTTQDVVIIIQSLAGNPAALANFKTSWRFSPTSHTMTIPPWGFPEKITLTGVSGDMPGQDFYGIKTGDIVAAYANPANFGADNPLVLNTQDRVLQSDEEVTVEFKAEQFDDLAAFQLALNFASEKLQFVEIQPSGGLPLVADNFGTYNIADGEIRVVWSQNEGMTLDEAAPVFQLKFNVLQGGGKLSEALQLKEADLPALAYTGALAESKVELKFSETSGTTLLAGQVGLQLYQNRPNPFNGTTAIGFVLPESCEAQVRIFDASGQMLAEKKALYPAGRNEETFNLEGVSGVSYYELVTPFGVLAKKMVAAGE